MQQHQQQTKHEHREQLIRMASFSTLPPTDAHVQHLPICQLFEQMISPPGYEAPSQREKPTSRLESTYVLSKEHKPIIASNFIIKRGWTEPIQRPVSRTTKLKLKIKQTWRKFEKGVVDFRDEYVAVMECMYGYGLESRRDAHLGGGHVYGH